MLAKRVIATAAVAAGLSIGVTTTAQAAPAVGQTQSASAVRASSAVWEDKGYFNSLHDCQVAGSFYVATGWARAYYCAPMTDNQHQELSILR